MKTSKKWSGLRLGLALLGALLALAVAGALMDGWRAFGRRADGPRRARMEKSPQWSSGHFVNPQPMVNDLWGSLTGAFKASQDASPSQPVPTVRGGAERFATPPATGLRVTWLGHSTIAGGDRRPAHPHRSGLGRARIAAELDRAAALVRAAVALDELPPIDAVVISHDHYDHLDQPTIVAMKDWDTTSSCRSASARTSSTGACPRRTSSSSTGGSARGCGALEIVVHAGAARLGPQLVIDTRRDAVGRLRAPRSAAPRLLLGRHGAVPRDEATSARGSGPFDLTMIEVGPVQPTPGPTGTSAPSRRCAPTSWCAAASCCRCTGGSSRSPIHGWTEPIERVLAAAKRPGAPLVSPKPGQSVEPRSRLPSSAGGPTCRGRRRRRTPSSHPR